MGYRPVKPFQLYCTLHFEWSDKGVWAWWQPKSGEKMVGVIKNAEQKNSFND